MSETNYEHLVSAGDWPTWNVTYEERFGELTAHITQPLRQAVSSGMVYGIATMEDVPAVEEKLGDDSEWVVDRDDPRSRELALLVHAPDLVNAIRKAVMRIEQLTGLHGDDAACSKAHERFVDHATWQVLAEIECDLIRAYDEATDTETV